MSSITSSTETTANVMIDMPSGITPPVSSDKAITLAGGLPMNYFARNEQCNNFGATIDFTINQIGKTNLLQNTLTLNAAIPFNVTLKEPISLGANVVTSDPTIIGPLLFGTNGTGNIALSQYGLADAFSLISIAFNNGNIFSRTNADIIQKCILPYTSCGQDFEASLPGFADGTIYDSKFASTPVTYLGLDGTIKAKFINPDDSFNIYSNSTTPEYNNRAINFSFQPVKDQATTLVMYVNFRYQIPLSVFIPNNAGEQSTLNGIESLQVSLTPNPRFDYGLFKLSAAGDKVFSDISVASNLVTFSTFKLGYTVVVPQQYIQSKTIVNGRPRNYKINYDDYSLHKVSTVVSPSSTYQQSNFTQASITINSIPKAIIVALVPKYTGNFASLCKASEGFALITKLSVGLSTSTSSSNFSDIQIINEITEQNGYKAINPFIKQLCGYPVMIRSDQLAFPDNCVAGQKSTNLALTVEGNYCSPLINQIFDVCVIIQNERTLSYVDGEFLQDEGFNINSKDIDMEAVFREGVEMNTQSASIVRGGLSLGPIIKTATKAFQSLYKNRSRIADLAKDIYRDTTAGRTISNHTGGCDGGKSVADYHY